MEMEPRHDHNRKKQYLGCLSKQQLIIVGVVSGLVLLTIVITVPAVLLSKKTDPSVPDVSFATGGDMLDFLLQSGDISRRDGLLATWFHRANGKAEMNQALASNAMVLEADVTLHGFGTADQKPIPIMAHPPNVTSDNTLDQWLDAVLESRKGIKLDFKSLASVGLSLDLLLQKNSSRGIQRPVWLNADILKDPLVPGFIPTINGTQFLELVQEKFPDVTLSLGWMILGIYNRAMMEEMYAVVKDLPQTVTFPIKAVHARSGWTHISWLLSQSSRFSLTLWQSSLHPTVEDLLFVRDNSHPARVYYDIYEPTLTLFRQAVEEQGRLRRFYPGGDLLDFLSGAHTQSVDWGRSLSVALVSVTDHTSLSSALRDTAGGMLVLRVGADHRHPGVPVVVPVGVPVVPSSEILTLEEVLEELSLHPRALWGLYLRVGAPELLGASLSSLLQFYNSDQLYRPVWLGMDPHAFYSVQEFVSTVDQLFPHCTIVLNEAVPAPDLSQRLAVHLSSLHLSELHTALRGLDTYEVILETDQSTTELTQLMENHRDSFRCNIYVTSKES